MAWGWLGQHQELMVSDGQVWRKEVNTNFIVVYRVGLALCWVTLGLALGVTNWMSIILSLVSSFAANCLINSSQILSFSIQIKRLYSLVLVWLLKVTFLVKKLNLFTNMLLISGSQWLFDHGCTLQISQKFLCCRYWMPPHCWISSMIGTDSGCFHVKTCWIEGLLEGANLYSSQASFTLSSSRFTSWWLFEKSIFTAWSAWQVNQSG